MKVYIERTEKHKEVKASTIKGLLKTLKINPTTVIVVKNNTLVTEDEKITSKDKIKLLSVISGG